MSHTNQVRPAGATSETSPVAYPRAVPRPQGTARPLYSLFERYFQTLARQGEPEPFLSGLQLLSAILRICHVFIGFQCIKQPQQGSRGIDVPLDQLRLTGLDQ